MRIIAIDPGYAKAGKGCAVALFDARVLIRVGFLRPERALPDELRGACADVVVWECPQVDDRTRTAAPAAVQLAAVGGMLAGMYAGACGVTCKAVTPTQWKGPAAKPVHHRRMWDVLSPPEREMLGGDATLERIIAAQLAGARDRWGKPGGEYYSESWLTHNLLDAVGLGLWQLGRMVAR